ncbi:MAG: hypothetical protein HC880_14075 [Bacteroidia bacterium]|nr:hypothetical protein [Bacteroidia bacterium]
MVGSPDDPVRNYHFLSLLRGHGIEVQHLDQDISLEGQRFEKGKAYTVPLRQAQSQLVEALFQKTTQFEDSLFYDISAWTLPLAFHLPYAQTRQIPAGAPIDRPEFPAGSLHEEAETVAYTLDWGHYYAPRALYRLLAHNLKVKVATEKAVYPAGKEVVTVAQGALVVPVADQPQSPEELRGLMQALARENGLDVYALSSGLAGEGIDLGSEQWSVLRQPKIALVVGQGVQSYEAGEVWHVLDQRYQVPLTLLDIERFRQSDLSRYNTLVLVSGNYSELSSEINRLLGLASPGQYAGSYWLGKQLAANYRGSKYEYKNASPARFIAPPALC